MGAKNGAANRRLHQKWEERSANSLCGLYHYGIPVFAERKQGSKVLKEMTI